MPKTAGDQLQRQIEYGKQGIDEVIESLSNVDSARATAWKLEDETKVKLEANLRILVSMGFSYVFMLFFIMEQPSSSTNLILAQEIIDPGALCPILPDEFPAFVVVKSAGFLGGFSF